MWPLIFWYHFDCGVSEIILILSVTCGCWLSKPANCRWLQVRRWDFMEALGRTLKPSFILSSKPHHFPLCEWSPWPEHEWWVVSLRVPPPPWPNPLYALYHMLAWVGLLLWVTHLWGTALARPLSPVSEPRLMTADDDPVVFSSLPPLLLFPIHSM